MSKSYDDIKHQMGPEKQFHVERLLDMEDDMKGILNGSSRFTESNFRRQGLPILTMMLDDTFDPQMWANYVGSMFVGLEIVSDSNYDEILFTLPPAMYTGQSLRQVEGQPSLSEESAEIYNQTLIMASSGHQMMASLIKDTLGGIDTLAHRENSIRAYNTIQTINFVFERYGIQGRVPMPEGLEATAKGYAGQAVTATGKPAVQQKEKFDGVGEDL
ncbi:hypothetical protein pEaSNUABM11_00039 [Erwinia phage pEa_SNUABM_11]|nr:hypothetical protein pEaSNUABM11_00039 [Erwinia phage pEa_SNUABM_11]